ncbi:NAD(P)-binding protein [Polychaeton citri CBS 116435]|uniref:Short-chain dehydrogenase/reductase 3 n=1 Tax=Polychaeton citri CBS 116435 TaxID=1314669 RepID=A0A9P4Q9Q6_9PEZI|nr:NAD(P)-binding protein [Polychaeton citri CBS 116435]
MALDRAFAAPVASAFAVGFLSFGALKIPLLSPAVTGTLTWALTTAPDSVRRPLLDQLSKYLSSKGIARGITVLKVLLGLGIARQVHNALSILAQDNMRLGSEKARYNWPQEIVLITGGAGGFGCLLSEAFAARGLTVISIDIAEAMPARLQGNSKIHYYQCDVTSRDAVFTLAERVRKEHGNPSILINNAGVGFNHTLVKASESAIRKIFEVNTISHYWTIQAFLPAMVADKKGQIVSMASMAAFCGTSSMGPYCSSKVAVLALHETLRQELRVIHKTPEVKCTIVHPTFAATPMTAKFKDELAGKAQIIDPTIVSNAVVNQVLSCKGGQIILPGDLTMIPVIMRGLPHWLTYALLRSKEDDAITKPGLDERAAD